MRRRSHVAEAVESRLLLASNPVAFYTFEEGTGSTTADVSGLGNTGTLASGASFGQGLIARYSLNLNGTTGYAQVANAANSAYAGGTWSGTGLTSSSARNAPNHNTTLAAIEADDFRSVYGPSATFGGELLPPTAVLVKYTYHGDANFSGTVNTDDYVSIDVGFNLGRTGWFNGDFNASGPVDFDDYVLIDVAFNTQGVAL